MSHLDTQYRSDEVSLFRFGGNISLIYISFWYSITSINSDDLNKKNRDLLISLKEKKKNQEDINESTFEDMHAKEDIHSTDGENFDKVVAFSIFVVYLIRKFEFAKRQAILWIHQLRNPLIENAVNLV